MTAEFHAGVPLATGADGRTRLVDHERHVRDMIEAVIFTRPGERVGRPTFGCAAESLLFRQNNDLLAGATNALIRASLQEWLGHEIVIDALSVEADGSRLEVRLSYQLRDDPTPYATSITREFS